MSAPALPAPRATMSLWRLERLRLIRTHRWMILFGVYALTGVIGALSARYLNELVSRFAGEVTIIAPDPRPVDGIIQFVSNATQLGLLAVTVVAAGALTVDAKPELAAFLRTKVQRPAVLLVPAYAVTAAATVVALVVGTGLAWGLTEALIGSLPVGPMLVGTLYGALFHAFAVAVVAAVAGFTRGQAATVFGALGVLILLPAFGFIDPVSAWMPSRLATAVAAMVDGVPAGEFVRSVATTVVATLALLALAARRLERREL